MKAAGLGQEGRVLFIPSVREGDGIGHLRRCLELLASYPNGSLYFGGTGDGERVRRVARAARLEVPEDRLVSEMPEGERWELVVLDRRATDNEELERFSRHGTVLGIDEGGEARDAVPYLIDTLPLLSGRGKANIYSPAFHALPENRRSPGAPPTGRAVVTFGGEDPEGLSSKMARALIEGGTYSPEQLTVVVGPLFRAQDYPRGVELLHSPRELRELLAGFDVVFTSFGITAYEAVNAGTSVILFNPTSYHRALSRVAAFPEIGIRTVDRTALRRLLDSPETLRRSSEAIAIHSQRSIPEHINGLDWSGGSACPVCGERINSSLGRFLDRSFFRCGHCGIGYELDFAQGRRAYDKSYFFEEYREQYGKTYLEDFDNIRGFATGRLARMEAIASSLKERRLLDVGCAFGPFLAEAAERGALVFGVDVVEEAVAYVQDELRLPCLRSSLEELDLKAAFGVEVVDFVTMWYVIEHFQKLDPILRKVNAMLPMGGMLAFSTPNLAGISGRSNLDQFLSASPRDHFTLWDPRISRKVLERFGFRVRGTHITGHHPERFPLGGASEGWRYRLLRRYSEMAQLGDTFECYAVKVAEIAS